MAKILMIIAQNGFRDEELLVPKQILEHAGHNVKVASITRGKATGSKGTSLQPDLAVYEANPAFFDCVVIVGGPGSPALAENGEVIDFVLGMSKKLVAAICLGPMTLAQAGILKDKKATIFPDRSAITLLRQSGGVYKTGSVVVDGNIVTADGPQSAEQFGTTIVKMLGELK